MKKSPLLFAQKRAFFHAAGLGEWGSQEFNNFNKKERAFNI